MDRLKVRAFEPARGCLAGPHGDMETSSEHSVIEATGTPDIGFQKRGWSRAPAVAAGQHRREIKLNPTLGPGQGGLTVSVWGPAWTLGCLHSRPGSEGSGPVSEPSAAQRRAGGGVGGRRPSSGVPDPQAASPEGPSGRCSAANLESAGRGMVFGQTPPPAGHLGDCAPPVGPAG